MSDATACSWEPLWPVPEFVMRDVAGVEDDEHLEDREEDQAGCEVLRRKLLAGEVDPVDERGDNRDGGRDEPLVAACTSTKSA